MDWLTGTSSRATFAATNGGKVVMTPTSSCYINFLETSSAGKSISEPPWQSGTVTLATAYAMNPIPVALPAAYTNNILGAQGNCWAEYIPSRVDMEFRAFPRLCALAEVNWTAPGLKITRILRIASCSMNNAWTTQGLVTIRMLTRGSSLVGRAHR